MRVSIQGLKGAMDSASGIVYGKAALEGKMWATSTVGILQLHTVTQHQLHWYWSSG